MEEEEFLTHTFSECVENHVGMQTIGKKRDVGFSEEQLDEAAREWARGGWAARGGGEAVAHRLAHCGERATVVVFPSGVDALCGAGAADALFKESRAQPFDKKILNTRRKVVQQKWGRYNNCYADEPQDPDIASGKGTVLDFKACSRMKALREALPKLLGSDAAKLYAETNLYYDVTNSKVGIGYHGDTERSIVVGIRLGPASKRAPLRFQWYHRAKAVTGEHEVALKHGDIYVMSHKATGHDWKKPSLYTLRHGAGLKAKSRGIGK